MADQNAPLAERMRPADFDEFVGQEDIVGENSSLRRLIERDQLRSVIFWGPPGSGKTTLARLIAEKTEAAFTALSAVSAGVKDVRQVIEAAQQRLDFEQRRTILFLDEIHRFNKAQQDAFLPHIEAGTIILIGATTENPSFEVNTPLLSRSTVVVFKPLDEASIREILLLAIEDNQRGLGKYKIEMEDDVYELLSDYCDGDARRALNTLETMVMTATQKKDGVIKLDQKSFRDSIGRKFVGHDRAGEEHFNTISALHKSMRNSDPDATLYWLGRMLEGGDDPLYVARRIVRFASEDVGMADPRALQVAMSAQQAVHFIGLPEGALALAEAAVYMATAPKSNALYVAYKEVQRDIQKTRNEPVPMQIRNAPTNLMKQVGYGSGYKYAHEYPEAVTDLQCLPDLLKNRKYFKPTSRGFERTIKERMAFLAKLRRDIANQKTDDNSGEE
jgi:putative ATPase